MRFQRLGNSAQPHSDNPLASLWQRWLALDLLRVTGLKVSFYSPIDTVARDYQIQNPQLQYLYPGPHKKSIQQCWSAKTATMKPEKKQKQKRLQLHTPRGSWLPQPGSGCALCPSRQPWIPLGTMSKVDSQYYITRLLRMRSSLLGIDQLASLRDRHKLTVPAVIHSGCGTSE